jgi:hypothetical protein
LLEILARRVAHFIRPFIILGWEARLSTHFSFRVFTDSERRGKSLITEREFKMKAEADDKIVRTEAKKSDAGQSTDQGAVLRRLIALQIAAIRRKGSNDGEAA